MAYRIIIDEDGADAIEFAGHRYSWSAALREHGINCEGTHTVSEHVAWKLIEAFDEDDALFPLLDPRSQLYGELSRFMGSVV